MFALNTEPALSLHIPPKENQALPIPRMLFKSPGLSAYLTAHPLAWDCAHGGHVDSSSMEELGTVTLVLWLISSAETEALVLSTMPITW